MNAIHSNRHAPVLEVPALEYDRIEPALDAGLLASIREYLDGAVFDGDPYTDFDCYRYLRGCVDDPWNLQPAGT